MTGAQVKRAFELLQEDGLLLDEAERYIKEFRELGAKVAVERQEQRLREHLKKKGRLTR